jgi:hypothetical protein
VPGRIPVHKDPEKIDLEDAFRTNEPALRSGQPIRSRVQMFTRAPLGYNASKTLDTSYSTSPRAKLGTGGTSRPVSAASWLCAITSNVRRLMVS